MRLDTNAQVESSFFKLPAEIRLAVYEYLTFPPIDNEQCSGLILSCKKAKRECEDKAVERTKEWLRWYKRETSRVRPVRILLPLPTRTPIGRHTGFHTLRHLTLVLPGHKWASFFRASRGACHDLFHFRWSFNLWLDSLTLHHCGPLKNPAPDMRGWTTEEHLRARVRRMISVLEMSFRYAHDPVGQLHEIEDKKDRVWALQWEPQPSFIKKLVISWDLTEHGLRSEDLIAVEGLCRKRSTMECPGMREHFVVGRDGYLGEYSRESRCRFRPSESEPPVTLRYRNESQTASDGSLLDLEDRLVGPNTEHEMTCLSCRGGKWDYRRYIRGLPTKDNERWL